MRLWSVAAVGLAMGCGTASGTSLVEGDGGAADVGADAGATLAARQFQAANALSGDMANGIVELTARYRATSNAESVYPQFSAADTSWRAALDQATAVGTTDAGLSERQAAIVRATIDPMFPAYCGVKASMPGVTPSVVPRIRCDEQPVTLELLVQRYP